MRERIVLIKEHERCDQINRRCRILCGSEFERVFYAKGIEEDHKMKTAFEIDGKVYG